MSTSDSEPAGPGVPSAAYLRWLLRERRGRVVTHGAQAALLIVFLVLWEILPRWHLLNPLFTSYPSALWPTLLELLHDAPQQPGLGRHALATTIATVIGLSGAMLLGTLIAAALWWWHGLYRVLEPYLVVGNAIPKTALVPIFYLWLGAALSVYAMSLAISLFITILVIYNGFQGVDSNKIKLAQTFGATRGQVLAKIVLPGSVPTWLAALKVTAGLSLVGVIVGEFQSANLGLGYLIQYGSQTFKMNIVMTAITVLVILSTAMYLAIGWVESVVMERR